MVRNSEFYSILTDVAELTKIVNNVNAQFDNTAWRSFMQWDVPQIDLTFGVLSKDYDISPMAAVIDTNAPKPDLGGNGINMYYDSMPSIGGKVTFTKNDFRNIAALQNTALGDSQMVDKLWSSVDRVIRGAHNRLNQMVFSGLTNGSIVINATNNPSGIPFSLDLRIPAGQKLKAGFNQSTKAAWSDGTNSDPVQDLIDMYQKSVTDKHPFGMYLMSLAKWNSFCAHPKVKSWVRNRMDSSNANRAIAPQEVQRELDMFYLPPIVILEQSYTQMVDGRQVAITDGFDEDFVVGCPIGYLGTIKNAIPASILAGVPSTPDAAFTYLEQNRFALLSLWDAQTIKHTLELEAVAVPTINVPFDIYTLDTSTAAS